MAGHRQVDHDLGRAAATKGAVRKIIPRVLDDRQQGIDVGLFRAEKLDQIGKAFAWVPDPVVVKDQLLDVLDRRLTLEVYEKIEDAGGKDRPVFEDAVDVGKELVHSG